MPSAEFAFIDMLRGVAPLAPGARDLRDDAGIIEIGGETLVVTCDTLVEGVHLLPDMDEADIAWRLVAANLSDLAAKGAKPLAVLVSHSVTLDDARFAAGLVSALGTCQADVLGGDTVLMPEGAPRSFTLTAIGKARHCPVPGRDGARPGDAIFVTGEIGAAMTAFEELSRDRSAAARAYRRPEARTYEGIDLAPHVSAMMDISDGLLLDAWRMAQASRVRLSIESRAVPLGAPEHRRAEALRWGDDYELLFTAPADFTSEWPIHRIGTVEAGSGISVDGEVFERPDGLGYQHGA